MCKRKEAAEFSKRDGKSYPRTTRNSSMSVQGRAAGCKSLVKDEKTASREQGKCWGGCVCKSGRARSFIKELTVETDKDLGNDGARVLVPQRALWDCHFVASVHNGEQKAWESW